MSLSFPSGVRGKNAASVEAEYNLSLLLRADARGNADQIATRAALQHFQRIRDLRPGYFDGVKSWAKSGCIYVGAGAATLGAIGLTAYAVYKVATQSDYGLHLLAGTSTAGWLSSEIGYAPINNLSALVLATVRDSANRAARSSMKADERSLEAREKEAKECHEKIIGDLGAVFNDVAVQLTEKLKLTERNSLGREQLALKEMSEALSDRMPAVETLLAKLNLKPNEIEEVLQRLKDSIRFVQSHACQLGSKPTDARKNAELLANWSGPISEIAVPNAIQERVQAAAKARFGIIQKTKGYCDAAFAMLPAGAFSAAAVGSIWAGYHIYNGSFADASTKVTDFFKNFSWDPKTWTVPAVTPEGGAVALGILIPTFTVGVKKTIEHSEAISDNATYVADELAAAKEELESIYSGIGRNLNDRTLAQPIRSKLPEISREIQALGFDSSDVLRNLQAALNR